ncbi:MULTISPECIES: SCO family protein [unclassified Sporosarcina]|uniref:SCO family protein n=1 Tax=unclassified Sporosarcina TaxID=2647733 RepID=UPI000C16BE70|nr:MULTISPECIES: SCO family protein [unclassified Sporosarcina]PIC99481.1 cytochrome c oxidase assembly protein [Sporosarcina sp. P29]PID06537.1 cytochrome c oxidase assembly protein [Sporosarcina sp. P30]PID09731.1 cytochrome c oxidase assembly protein [Sporosarcina sp. P31]PID13310.1 cytochrome c oxidase assembly protein [Sporosarcina sp. P32b]
MYKKLLVPLTLIFVLLLSACGGGFKPDHKYKVDSFEFTNQNNETVTDEDLKGSVWLAQFVFTKCTTVCPPMMSNMVTLQEELIDNKIEDYNIVSFSVDPDVDTPEELAKYLDLFSAPDESKWQMLTGYDMKTIEKIAASSFKQLVKQIPNDDQVIHGVSFGLVNQNNEVVKLYGGNEDVQYDTIVKDMKALIKEGK